MVERGLHPVLAGRRRNALEGLADELGGLEAAVADAAEPGTVRALVQPGDVLVTTVGPFLRHGSSALGAAIDAAATYLDSNGEPPFIRRVFEQYGPLAERVGIQLLPSFAFDSVPGNVAAALALRSAGDAATRVDVGYFMPGHRHGWDSGGSRASFVGAAIEPSFVWRGGIRTERGAARVRSFEVAGQRRHAVSAGTSEHFALPRLFPRLHEVNSYLGYLAGPPRAMQVLSLIGAAALHLPGLRSGLQATNRRLLRGSTGGPDAEGRAKTSSEVVAIAYDSAGRELSSVRLAGATNSYDFSARMLAWGSEMIASGHVADAGALGPVEAFGLDVVDAGVADCGIRRRG
jgi:short subunit dehydrogenase-like uncharacterized protein